jgi:hypothetical protein
MVSIEMIIRDEDGTILGQGSPEYLDLGQQSLHEIEGAVETWRKKVLPAIEAELLAQAQIQYTQAQKNKEI